MRFKLIEGVAGLVGNPVTRLSTAGRETTSSSEIFLEAGKAYFIEMHL